MRKHLAGILIVLLAFAFGAGTSLAASKTVAPKKAEVAKTQTVAKKTVKKTEKKTVKTAKSAKTSKGKKSAKKASAPLPKSDWSPNNFPAGNRGWCTWYTDGRYARYFGKKLELNPRPGSNAYLWYQRAQNVERSKEPMAGDIMVIKRPKGDRTGHVAFVEEVISGEEWIVTQANFDFRGHQPLEMKKIDGRKVFTDVFVRGPKAGTVKLKGGNTVYNLLGFIRYKASEEEITLAQAFGPALPEVEGITLPASLETALNELAQREEVAALTDTFGGFGQGEIEPFSNIVAEAAACGCDTPVRVAL